MIKLNEFKVLNLVLLLIFSTPRTWSADAVEHAEDDLSDIGGVFVPAHPLLENIQENTAKKFRAAQTHPELNLPKHFATGNLKDWKKKAKDLKIPVLDYLSEGAQRRTLFFESNEKFDRWTIAINDLRDDGKTSAGTASALAVIVIDKVADPTKKKIFFSEHHLEKKKMKRMAKPPLCYECHLGMKKLKDISDLSTEEILGVDPQGIDSVTLAQKRVKDLNEVIRSYGIVDWGVAFQPGKILPSLGRYVAEENSCIDCHNNKKVENLNPFARRLIDGQIHNGHMPPDSQLNEQEKAELMKKLFGSEYQNEIIEKLRADNPKAKSVPNLDQVKDFLTPKAGGD